MEIDATIDCAGRLGGYSNPSSDAEASADRFMGHLYFYGNSGLTATAPAINSHGEAAYIEVNFQLASDGRFQFNPLILILEHSYFDNPMPFQAASYAEIIILMSSTNFSGGDQRDEPMLEIPLWDDIVSGFFDTHSDLKLGGFYGPPFTTYEFSGYAGRQYTARVGVLGEQDTANPEEVAGPSRAVGSFLGFVAWVNVRQL